MPRDACFDVIDGVANNPIAEGTAISDRAIVAEVATANRIPIGPRKQRGTQLAKHVLPHWSLENWPPIHARQVEADRTHCGVAAGQIAQT